MLTRVTWLEKAMFPGLEHGLLHFVDPFRLDSSAKRSNNEFRRMNFRRPQMNEKKWNTVELRLK